MKILVLNGPNLNLLGYKGAAPTGEMTLTEMNKALAEYCADKSEEPELVFYQTNHEGQLIDMIQKANLQYEAMVLNPGALCSYSFVLRDAVESACLPVAEVHLDDLGQLEAPRNHSIIGEVSAAQFMGKQLDSYKEALDYLIK